MRDPFSSYHPILNFGYFTVMLLSSMFFMHPVFQGIALLSAVTYSLLLKGRSGVKFHMLYMLPLLLFMAAMNPAFNHAGVTILFYLKSGNPVTLESIVFGVSAACMFVTVIIWFSCYNAVMTSDKFIYIFGKILPSLSLILSMVLRFVPRYIAQMKTISNAQKCIGRDMSQGNMLQRARNGIAILSILTTWALENAIETADSMKSRGYGLHERTSYSNFRFDRRDRIMLAVLAGLIACVLVGAVLGENTIRFFPSIKVSVVTPVSYAVYIAYFALCTIPVQVAIMEEVKWKYIESKT